MMPAQRWLWRWGTRWLPEGVDRRPWVERCGYLPAGVARRRTGRRSWRTGWAVEDREVIRSAWGWLPPELIAAYLARHPRQIRLAAERMDLDHPRRMVGYEEVGERVRLSAVMTSRVRRCGLYGKRTPVDSGRILEALGYPAEGVTVRALCEQLPGISYDRTAAVLAKRDGRLSKYAEGQMRGWLVSPRDVWAVLLDVAPDLFVDAAEERCSRCGEPPSASRRLRKRDGLCVKCQMRARRA